MVDSEKKAALSWQEELQEAVAGHDGMCMCYYCSQHSTVDWDGPRPSWMVMPQSPIE